MASSYFLPALHLIHLAPILTFYCFIIAFVAMANAPVECDLSPRLHRWVPEDIAIWHILFSVRGKVFPHPRVDDIVPYLYPQCSMRMRPRTKLAALARGRVRPEVARLMCR